MTINSGFTRLLAALSLLLGATSAFAATRTVTIDAPAEAVAGSKVSVTFSAATDVGGNEQIGFLYAAYSVDGGLTWTGTCFDQSVGPKATRNMVIPVGAKGSQAKVRVMAAFRGGKAGDVDYSGAPIKWDGSWSKWETPPARYVTIAVK
ncbi:MAG TPA: hypothetical protein VG734_10620 [Lacunisphaera sp.]|nr:hypothetical protein [Lacunisphaera sp.]